jgi:hypothetical protein
MPETLPDPDPIYQYYDVIIGHAISRPCIESLAELLVGEERASRDKYVSRP